MNNAIAELENKAREAKAAAHKMAFISSEIKNQHCKKLRILY
jgi:hypothetical protein